MPETKTQKEPKNISEEKVRCPPELMTALRQEAATYGAIGKKAPPHGDMLLVAWRCYEASKLSDTGKHPNQLPTKELANPLLKSEVPERTISLLLESLMAEVRGGFTELRRAIDEIGGSKGSKGSLDTKTLKKQSAQLKRKLEESRAKRLAGDHPAKRRGAS